MLRSLAICASFLSVVSATASLWGQPLRDGTLTASDLSPPRLLSVADSRLLAVPPQPFFTTNPYGGMLTDDGAVLAMAKNPTATRGRYSYSLHCVVPGTGRLCAGFPVALGASRWTGCSEPAWVDEGTGGYAALFCMEALPDGGVSVSLLSVSVSVGTVREQRVDACTIPGLVNYAGVYSHVVTWSGPLAVVGVTNEQTGYLCAVKVSAGLAVVATGLHRLVGVNTIGKPAVQSAADRFGAGGFLAIMPVRFRKTYVESHIMAFSVTAAPSGSAVSFVTLATYDWPSTVGGSGYIDASVSLISDKGLALAVFMQEDPPLLGACTYSLGDSDARKPVCAAETRSLNVTEDMLPRKHSPMRLPTADMDFLVASVTARDGGRGEWEIVRVSEEGNTVPSFLDRVVVPTSITPTSVIGDRVYGADYGGHELGFVGLLPAPYFVSEWDAVIGSIPSSNVTSPQDTFIGAQAMPTSSAEATVAYVARSMMYSTREYRVSVSAVGPGPGTGGTATSNATCAAAGGRWLENPPAPSRCINAKAAVHIAPVPYSGRVSPSPQPTSGGENGTQDGGGKAGNAGKIAAAVLIPLATIAAAGAAFVWHRRKIGLDHERMIDSPYSAAPVEGDVVA